MPRKLKKTLTSDNAIGWFMVGLGVIVAVKVDAIGAPQRWHAALVWTATTCYAVVIFGKQRWASWRFWLSFVIGIAAHLIVMWVLFAKILVHVEVIGTLFVIPIGLVEGILLLVIILKIERQLLLLHSR